MSNTNFRNLYFLIISAVVLVIDQISKHWVMANLSLGQPQPVMPSLNLTLSHNRGAAFGLLHEASGWQRWFFIGVALLVSVVIIGWLSRLSRRETSSAMGLCLIFGGALGNLWDRIAYGHVIDFIDFYIGGWHWYTFNIADSAICIGIGLLLISLFRKHDEAL